MPEEYSSDYWLANYDTIAFHLPNGFQIIEASQSFLIMPSIWAKYEDEVVQFVEFHDLKMHCKNPKDLKINNNMLINGFDIDEKLSTELYFRNKKHINKNELLMSLQKQYDANAREINKMKIDENITALDKKKLLTDIQREKKIYSGYLKNYTNWETASRHQLFSKDGSELPGEQFELLAVKRYLTFTIKCGDKLDKITIVYTPTYGN